MATQAAIKRIQVWIWVLIYGGLLTFILGHFVSRSDVAMARLLGSVGMVAVVVGVVLIFVRAKMKAPPPQAANHPGDKR